MTVSLLVAAVLLALWTAVYLSLQARPHEAAVDDCGPVSTSEQQSLLWLMRLRADDGMALSEISLRPCTSGTRSGATAFVEVGRSAAVQEYFAARHHCDVRQACWISTETAGLMVRLSFVSGDGWYLDVRPQPAG